jgi:hypothetical protein
MISGNSSALLSIARDTWHDLQINPQTDSGVIAEVFARKFNEFRRREAEQLILAPLGLDIATFLRVQRDMAPAEVAAIREELQGHRLKSGAIIAGVDNGGAHIYVVRDPGRAVCNDIVGFAAIGYGQWHAESQFMFAQYVTGWEFERALRLIYLAKKRAEVPPGVGRETDLFFIGPHPSPQTPIVPAVVNKLEEIYQQHVEYTKVVGDMGDQSVKEYMKSLTQQASSVSTEAKSMADAGFQNPTPQPGEATGTSESEKVEGT